MDGRTNMRHLFLVLLAICGSALCAEPKVKVVESGDSFVVTVTFTKASVIESQAGNLMAIAVLEQAKREIGAAQANVGKTPTTIDAEAVKAKAAIDLAATAAKAALTPMKAKTEELAEGEAKPRSAARTRSKR